MYAPKGRTGQKHVQEFESILEVFRNTHGNGFVVDEDSEPGEWIFRARVVTPFPEVLPLILGDAIQNLRSALDHLACALVIHNSGPTADLTKTAFPITSTAKTHVLTKDTKVNGMSHRAVEIINSLKPYKGGNDGLWLIHGLNLVDKHRLLLVCGLAQAFTVTSFVPFFLAPLVAQLTGTDGTVIAPASSSVLLEDGAELFRVPAIVGYSSHMHMNTKFSINIALREPGIDERQTVVPALTQLVSLVENVINMFDPLV